MRILLDESTSRDSKCFQLPRADDPFGSLINYLCVAISVWMRKDTERKHAIFKERRISLVLVYRSLHSILSTRKIHKISEQIIRDTLD
jgi:hypothetical protein